MSWQRKNEYDKDKQKTKDKSERVLMMNLSLACSVVPLSHDKNVTRPESTATLAASCT